VSFIYSYTVVSVIQANLENKVVIISWEPASMHSTASSKKHYSAPLHALTQEGCAFCMDSTVSAFEQLKELLMSPPILAYPNFEKKFLLKIDTSISGLGAVLAQRQPDASVRQISPHIPAPWKELWPEVFNLPYHSQALQFCYPLPIWPDLSEAELYFRSRNCDDPIIVLTVIIITWPLHSPCVVMHMHFEINGELLP